MPRRAQVVSYLTGLAILLLAIGLVALHGQEALSRYGWVVLPGIFAIAIAVRVAESVKRRRRMARFRQRR